MGRTKLQKGFAHLAMLLLILIVVTIAFVGYRVVQNRSEKKQANTTSTSITQTKTIKSNTDLDNASKTLDNQSVDNGLNPDTYNDDVKSLL